LFEVKKHKGEMDPGMKERGTLWTSARVREKTQHELLSPQRKKKRPGRRGRAGRRTATRGRGISVRQGGEKEKCLIQRGTQTRHQSTKKKREAKGEVMGGRRKASFKEKNQTKGTEKRDSRPLFRVKSVEHPRLTREKGKPPRVPRRTES